MPSSILRVKDDKGNIINIPAIKGDKGDKGDSYVLTPEDKQEIANMVDVETVTVDPTYNPESENAQSGVAVAEALEKSLFTFKEIDLEGTYTDFYVYDDEAPSPSGIYEVTDYWVSGDLYQMKIELGELSFTSKKEITGFSVGCKIYIEVEESDSMFRSVNKLALQTADYVAREVFDNAIKNPILNYIDYKIVNNEAVITSCETSISGDHIIPETIDGYPVTDIGEAFMDCYALTGITIPGTIKTVGGNAFANCSILVNVIISEGVTTVAGWAFEDCSYIRFVSIPESLTSIDADAFCNGDDITDVYYAGSEEQWNNIAIGEWNGNLTSATIHYNQALAKKADVVEIVESMTSGGSTPAKFTTVYESGDIYVTEDEYGDVIPESARKIIQNINLTKCLIVVEDIDNNLDDALYLTINNRFYSCNLEGGKGTILIDCDVEDGILRVKWNFRNRSSGGTTSVIDISATNPIELTDEKINTIEIEHRADYRFTIYGK